MSGRDEPDDADRADEWLLGTLLDDAQHGSPEDLAPLVARAARHIGATDAVIYLVGYEQRLLTPLAGEGVPSRQRLDIDHTLGGRAFRTSSILRGEADGGERLWIPLLEAPHAWA